MDIIELDKIQLSLTLIVLLLLPEMDFPIRNKDRRTFLRLAVVGVISLIGVTWNKLTQNHIAQLNQKIKILPFNKNKTVSFFEHYIVINHNKKTTVLSARCTHLGCTINKVEQDKFLCPCHGSEFSLDGKVLNGPAYRDLENIPAKISDDGSQIEIL